MIKRLMLAVAMVALIAAPALAAVQNVKVGGELKTTSIIRDGFDLGSAAEASNNRSQNIVLSQVLLNVDADLTDNVSTKIGLKNERLWSNMTGANSNVDSSTAVKMETAYITLKEFLYSPLTVSLGRQPLAYGNELVIGKAGRNNAVAQVTDLTGDANFDAIKAVLNYDPLTVDLFAAKIDQNKLLSSDVDSNVHLFGVNANYKLGDKMSTVVEAYVFAKTTAVGLGVAGGNTKDDAIYVPGLRVSTNPIEGLNVQLEGAYQTGTLGISGDADEQKQRVKAFALQGMANYALPVAKDMKPVLSGSFTYLSGENEPDVTNLTKTTKWQTMYGNQFVGTIWNTLFSQSNLIVGSLAVEANPIKDLTTKLTWYGLAVADKVGSFTLAQPDGATPGTWTAPADNKNKDLGNEVDLDLTYAYTEDVKFGVSAGMFIPGKMLTSGFKDKDSAKQLLTSVNVAF